MVTKRKVDGKTRIQDLAAQMIPGLMAGRHATGKGGWDDDEWVAYAVNLAKKIVAESEDQVARTLTKLR